jgi:hypothetical protein
MSAVTGMPGATWKFAGASRRPTPSIAARGRTARCCSAALNPWARVCVDHLLAVGFARGAPRPGRRRPGRLFTSVAGDGVAPNAVHPPMEETIRREIERFDLKLRVLLGEDKQTRCRGPTPLPRSRVRRHAVRRRQAAARASPLLRSYAPRAAERPRRLARSDLALRSALITSREARRLFVRLWSARRMVESRLMTSCEAISCRIMRVIGIAGSSTDTVCAPPAIGGEEPPLRCCVEAAAAATCIRFRAAGVPDPQQAAGSSRE